MKKTLILICLISLSLNADDCTSKSESDCNSDSKCKWTSPKCAGDSGTTCSSVTSQETCGTTTYTDSLPCVFTPAVPSCSGTVGACASFNETFCGSVAGCTYESSTCSGTATLTCASISDATLCRDAGCTYSAGTATCRGEGSTCDSHTTNENDCTGTNYTTSETCSWNSGSCSANGNGNGDGNGDGNGSLFLKLSFSFFAILFNLF